MSKRFTDTEKWKDEWFMNLSNDHKVLWQYLLDNCNNAGIFDANWRLMSFHMNFEVREKEFEDAFELKISKISSKKYILREFIAFQQGELKPNVPAHKIIYRQLRDAGLCSFDISENEIKGKRYQCYTNIDARLAVPYLVPYTVPSEYPTLYSLSNSNSNSNSKEGTALQKDSEQQKIDDFIAKHKLKTKTKD